MSSRMEGFYFLVRNYKISRPINVGREAPTKCLYTSKQDEGGMPARRAKRVELTFRVAWDYK